MRGLGLDTPAVVDIVGSHPAEVHNYEEARIQAAEGRIAVVGGIVT